RDLVAELGRELAVDRGDVHPDLLEDTAMHHRHYAAAAIATARVLALPGGPDESPGSMAGKRRFAGELILEPLECAENAITEIGEPGGGPCLAGFDIGGHGGTIVRQHCRRQTEKPIPARFSVILRTDTSVLL